MKPTFLLTFYDAYWAYKNSDLRVKKIMTRNLIYNTDGKNL